MPRCVIVVLSTLLLLTACSPEGTEVGEDASPAGAPAPPDAAAAAEPFVSPYTNTPMGGSHVRRRQGRPLVRANKIDITIDDIIAHNGPRVPSFEDAPKDFSTAFVAVTLHGQAPSPELLERTDGIRREWMRFWSIATGGVGTMSTSLDR